MQASPATSLAALIVLVRAARVLYSDPHSIHFPRCSHVVDSKYWSIFITSSILAYSVLFCVYWRTIPSNVRNPCATGFPAPRLLNKLGRLKSPSPTGCVLLFSNYTSCTWLNSTALAAPEFSA